MPYVKPGVEVTQQRDSFSPNLVAPTLVPAIIGAGYHVEDIKPSASTFMSNYADTVGALAATAITYSGLNAGWAVDLESVYVDVIISSGASSQEVLHIDKNSDNMTSIAATIVTIGALDAKWSGATIKVGYRAVRSDLDNLTAIENTNDITNNIGEISIWNPLALGIAVAKTNAGNNAVSYYGVSGFSTNESTAHSNARDDLELEEVYAMAPLTQTEGIQVAYTTHANSMSLPINKKERINLVNPPIPWKTTADGNAGDHTFTGASKGNTASQTRAVAFAAAETRAVYTFPDVLYARVDNQHISTLSPSHIQNTIWGTTNPNLNAILATDYEIKDPAVAITSVDPNFLKTDGSKTSGYKIVWPVGTELTLARYNIAKTSVYQEDGYLSAYVPVPGHYTCAALAGKIAAIAPEQGLTNLSLNVLDGLKFSNDWFSESQLNTIADGGNFIVTQDVKFRPPYYVRHQLTTNRDSVETQELSIVKTIDYVSKFVRGALARQIGRFNITPRYLGQLRMILGALKDELVGKGVVSDMAITTLAQHATQKDRVVITLSTQVYYPANYIDVTIVY